MDTRVLSPFCPRSLTPLSTGTYVRLLGALVLIGVVHRTKLSKALVTDASKLEWRSAAELQNKYHVDLRTGKEVTSIDVVGNAVIVGTSGERVPYKSLVLATGGTPRTLPVEGKNLGNVFTMRGVKDAKNIDEGDLVGDGQRKAS